MCTEVSRRFEAGSEQTVGQMVHCVVQMLQHRETGFVERVCAFRTEAERDRAPLKYNTCSRSTFKAGLCQLLPHPFSAWRGRPKLAKLLALASKLVVILHFDGDPCLWFASRVTK